MPLSKEFYLDEIRSKHPNSYNESLKDLPIKDLSDMLDFLDEALGKADGGSIGIEVLFGPKREDFNIGGNVQRATTPQPYDSRATAADFARAIDKVGAGTNMQKAMDIQRYGQNVQRQNALQKFGDHARVSQAMKGKTGMPVIPEYGFQTGLDFQEKFSGLNPKISAGLAAAYQTLQEGSRALNPFNPSKFLRFPTAMKTAQEQASKNIEGILASDTGTITPQQQAERNKYLASQGQPTEPVIDQSRISEIVEQQKAAGVPDEGLITNFNKPTMADVAGPSLTQYSNIPELTRLIDDNPNINSLAEANDYLKMQAGVVPGFTKLKNPDGAPGNYNEFMYKGPDGQIYGSQTYSSIAAGQYPDIYNPNRPTMAGVAGPSQEMMEFTGESFANVPISILNLLRTIPASDYRNMGPRRQEVEKIIQEKTGKTAADFLSLKDGGRVGFFMGGPALEGQALNIYNSMNSYGFTDQQIADALQGQGLYTPSGSSTPETTAPNIINQQINQGGGGGDGGIMELQETFRTEPGDPKNFRLSQLEGTTDYFPPTTMMGKAKNFLQELSSPQVRGTLGTRMANQPRIPIPSFASFLSNYSSPFNMQSKNYNPLMESQLNFLETQDGMIGRNPNSGLLQYGPESVLAGKNVFSFGGTNDPEKALIDYITKMNANKRISTQRKTARLAQAEAELKALREKTEAARAAQYGATNYGRGSDGQRSYSGDAIGASGLGFGVGATTGGPVSNRTGRGRTDYSKGGLATMFVEKR